MNKKILKEEYANRLLESGIEPYSVVRHSYTNDRMNEGGKNLDQVQNTNRDLCPTLDTRCDCLGVVVMEEKYTDIEKALFTPEGNIKRYLGGEVIDEFKEGQMATTTYPNGYGHGPRTHNESIALNTIDKPSVKVNLRIRKLVPVECMKLMGFERKDYEAMREIGMSDAQIYHCAGDSIITSVLAMIIGQIIPIEEEELKHKVLDYTNSLVEGEDE